MKWLPFAILAGVTHGCTLGAVAQERTASSDPTAPTPHLEAAMQIEDAFTSVAERVFPSVVGISGWRRESGPAPSGESPKSSGWRVASQLGHPGYRRITAASGFLLSEDGHILTTARVLEDPEGGAPVDLVEVELSNRGTARARRIGVEPTLNLAVLKVEVPFELAAVTLGDSDDVKVGQWAIALGDPRGPGKTFATGVISSRPERECYQEERTATLLQSSVRIPPASYGGPLVNIRGEVIGINLPPGVSDPLFASSPPVSAFALPIDLAMTVYGPLRAKESKRSPWLGISVLELTWRLRKKIESPPPTGIYIDDVFDPSPASEAGVQVGDVLTKMDGESMLTVSNFQQWLYLYGIGQTITLELSRAGETVVETVTIEERPASATMR